jgi:SAM-dependent methyltransferase
VEAFDRPEALEINRARLKHLESLDLPIQGKSVLDVGCGVGHLSRFFIENGCRVFCIDGREENISSLKERYPDLDSAVADVEKDSLSDYGFFDIVFCYGLLYHLENPTIALKNMASVCREMLLLETCITDHPYPLIQLVEESATYNQSLTGLGTRPTPSYVVTAMLHAGFSYVYVPETRPEFPDFKFSWKGDLSHWRDSHPLRQIFIASKNELVNANLILVGQCD